MDETTLQQETAIVQAEILTLSQSINEVRAPYRDEINTLIEGHAAFTDLKRSVDRSITRLYGKSQGAERIKEMRGEDYLAHTENSEKSALAQKQRVWQWAIIRELGLPLTRERIWSSLQLDWFLIAAERRLLAGLAVSDAVLEKYPALRGEDELSKAAA